MPRDDDYFDPFGWDDDVEFDPEKLEAGAINDDGDINDISDLWDLYEDYDFEDLQTYEFHGTGDTGG